MSATPPSTPRRFNRRILIVAAVVGFHVFALWALQSGLLRRAVEMVIPIEVLAEMIEPAQPIVTPEPPPQQQQQQQRGNRRPGAAP